MYAPKVHTSARSSSSAHSATYVASAADGSVMVDGFFGRLMAITAVILSCGRAMRPKAATACDARWGIQNGTTAWHQ